MKVTDLLYKKFDIAQFKMSKHFLEDRNNRIVDILCKPEGFGIVTKIIEEDTAYRLITNTKVSIIIDKQGEKVVTAYEMETGKYLKLLAI